MRNNTEPLYKIGEWVREGGPKGPKSKIKRILGNSCGLWEYETIALSNDGKRYALGYFNENSLYPCEQIEQLKLF